MNRHQVLTGAANPGDSCFAVGSVEGVHFTAYATGCDIVILASDFQRVQIIPGAVHGYVLVTCVTCSTETGKIAASYGDKVRIFEPTPLIHTESSHKLDYQWYHTATLTIECTVVSLSWNQEGSRLLSGGDTLQLWQAPEPPPPPGTEPKQPVEFFIDGGESSAGGGAAEEASVEQEWACVWQCRPATPVSQVQFSPDGLLFATVGKADRLVKIWYENKKGEKRPDLISRIMDKVRTFEVATLEKSAAKSKKSKEGTEEEEVAEEEEDFEMLDVNKEDEELVQLPMPKMDSVTSPKKEEVNYSFVYIAHPRAVTGFSWRKTSKYMPRGSVANMLITACKDNICRIWCETILPDDGLVDVNQLDPNVSQNPMFHTQRHKKRFMQRLHHIRHVMHRRKRNSAGTLPGAGIPPLPSTHSIHDFHKYGVHPNSVAPGFHFHLAASINPDTDIPLLPAMSNSTSSPVQFVVHWLNNKELHFTHEAEQLLEEIGRSAAAAAAEAEADGDGEEGEEDGGDDTEEDTGGESGLEHNASSRASSIHSATAAMSASSSKRRSKASLLLRKSRSHLSTESDASMPSTASMASGMSDPAQAGDTTRTCSDALDHRIETLLRDWHQGADMLYSIHPVDGSFLVWLVDWLDEYIPGSFRQAQVSFSSRIPQAFPIGDAMTMSPHLLLYCNYGKLHDLKDAMKETDSDTSSLLNNTGTDTKSSSPPPPPAPKYTANAMGKSSPGQSDNTLIPNVLMLSKHTSGSLNQWQISFAERTRFGTVVSVAHASRTCGHRFQTNSAACHPVLPLLLTTSHHNKPASDGDNNVQAEASGRSSEAYYSYTSSSAAPLNGPLPGTFCSELILWRVDPVGPLSKSGGISELARVNSPHQSAFSNVAWLPTLLPSSTLGQSSNSPSALFVASDGECLRVYQAVIDARTLLTEAAGAKKRTEILNRSRSNSSTSSGIMQHTPSTPVPAREQFNIVSLQSTSRPGCIIQLDTITQAKQDWQHISLIHVFQEQLIAGQNQPGKEDANIPNDPMIDLQNAPEFQEYFYLVVVEKLANQQAVLHMWKIGIASTGDKEGPAYTPDVNYFQEETGEESAASSRSQTPEPSSPAQQFCGPRLNITSTKVCSQMLDLPESVHVASATMAAGHLSSSSIYPACFAPYLLATACTDGRVRLWKCHAAEEKYMWREWEGMMGALSSSMPQVTTVDDCNASSIMVPGKPISVRCGYSGRVAVAYRTGSVRTKNDDPDSKLVNLCVAIYECESSGGAEWVLEDKIDLKNISVPDHKLNIDLRYIYDEPDQAQDGNGGSNGGSQVLMHPTLSTPAIVKTVTIPSPSTVQSIKRILSQGNTVEPPHHLLRQKHIVQLDWVSTEDGAHILTVAVGAKIMLYAAVSSEIASASSLSATSATSSGPGKNAAAPGRRRGLLQKSKSMTVGTGIQEEIRWMKVRSIQLATADALPPLPMHISWVRDGLLVVGMDNEMHVYSQWRGPGGGVEGLDERTDSRTLTEKTLTEQSMKLAPSASTLNIAGGGLLLSPSPSMASLKLTGSMSTMSLKLKAANKRGAIAAKPEMAKSESFNSFQLIQDCGLFEAARLANPVLPQYHPKQLIELLNFGKIRRVKAILAHLVRCIAGHDNSTLMFGDDSARGSGSRLVSSPRALSVAGPSKALDASAIPEDVQPDYLEISSIPPLPLYALLASDHDSPHNYPDAKSPTGRSAGQQDYSTLFVTNVEEDDELDDPFDDSTEYSSNLRGSDRRASSSHTTNNPNYFGPSQSTLLTKHLTHTQLPGLSSLDQMYLLALADTVSNTTLDFSEKQAAEMSVQHTLKAQQSGSGLSGGQQAGMTGTESMDDCGLRYMLAARHYVYLMNTLPIRQRAQLQRQGLNTSFIVWAFHSESEEELLAIIPSQQKGEPAWSELRMFGVGWWVRNINTLRRSMEKLAKAAFMVNKDPLDAAIFYLAMKKKAVLWGLFRSVNDDKMATFFKQNFSEDRWRKAALKNAFALLGKQRFLHAAAFFMLGGALRDAIEVCLNKLEDIQLAMVLARLYDSELDDSLPASLKRILYEECLGCSPTGQDYDSASASPDPFVRSMAYWMLRDYSAALGTMLENNVGAVRKLEARDADAYSSNPSVFNFYNYLRTHPLLVRQQIAMTAADKSKTVLLSGFSHGGQATAAGDKNVTYIDRITPIERTLYFATAHTHFKSGCPMLALEVLSKLPNLIDIENDVTKSRSAENVTANSQIHSGKLEEVEKVTDMDWSQPVVKDSTDTLDWSKPATVSSGMDWSQPVSKVDDDELKLDWGDDDDEDDVEDDQDDKDTKSDSETECKLKQEEEEEDDPEIAAVGKENSGGGDIMAQQLKFMACLKIMMEELATLATGFEVDGGQLRFQLFVWLEREVEVLKKLTNYGHDAEQAGGKGTIKGGTSEGDDSSAAESSVTEVPTLHEVILAEKMDFEAKLARMARRKRWLQSNQQLLRTLLSYSVLHGACGGGLASVRMELILLLQELQQEKTQQQLLSPLPFPTTLPLLSASVASAKTVIADPLRHLQATTQDILHTIIEFKLPPNPTYMLNKVFVLRNLSVALSSCIYQCLCDSDSFVVALSDHIDVGMEGFTSSGVVYKDSSLMAGAQRRRTYSSADEAPNSQPAKWPGVSTLRSLLASQRDEDAPRLSVLLVESLLSVYCALLLHALAMYDANLLYRLLAHVPREPMWPALFGGGLKKLVRIATSADQSRTPSKPKDDMGKRRLDLHMKVLGKHTNTQRLKEDKPTYKERFVPPEVNMVNYFLTKPYSNPNEANVDYDSANSISSDEEDEEEEFIATSKTNDMGTSEHSDPGSYSWCLMRFSAMSFVNTAIRTFLPAIGMELPELPVCSPLLQALLKTLEQWEELLKGRLELFNGPPVEYIPGCFFDHMSTTDKYKGLMDPNQTPFLSSHYSALPAKRLWHHLVRQDKLQDIFIRYIFKRKIPQVEIDSYKTSSVDGNLPPVDDPCKIVHKDQDGITTFCVNQYAGSWNIPNLFGTNTQDGATDSRPKANLNGVSLGTPKEVVELDISGILSPPAWMEDETEYDIENIKNPSQSRPEADDFLLVSAPADRYMMGGNNQQNGGPMLAAPGVIPAPLSAQSGRGGSVVKGLTNPANTGFIMDRSQRLLRRLTKRRIEGVRRMGSHPHLPYYLTGSQDGSVRLWEWGHQQHIAVARQPGTFPRCSRVLFNAQGNKFGVSDSEGSLCLWQVGLGVNMSRPFLSLKCHNKSMYDFVFVGSSSLLATAGMSSENKNVCIWDTLLPQRNSMVQAFTCHTDGAAAVLYAPQHQLLITGGKRGDVTIFDVRQRQLRHTFQAHDAAIRCMTLDPMEDYFVTGSADGDIKIWGLNVHNQLYCFPAEHTKGSLFSKMTQGVSQLYASPTNHIFSCGADGSLKVRHLPPKEMVVNTYGASLQV